MTREDFLILYEKCLYGNCSFEEEHLLKTYVDHFELSDLPWEAEMGDKKEIRSKIYARLHHETAGPSFQKRSWHYWSIAASILFAVSIGLFFVKKEDKFQKTAQNNIPEFKQDIAPGGNKAVLILANGSAINLDNSNPGELSGRAHVSIHKVADGRLEYDLKNNSGAMGTASMNEIRTPRGGQYQVTLSDGTQIWLNASSSIKFPEVFNGQVRQVELKGEAYFEVAKNKAKPFKVKTSGQEITVLGTHFNVNAYDDEDFTKTTLLEGSVRLKSDGAQALLVPGQQATLTRRQNGFTIKPINTDEVVDWKNGIFSFENTDIFSIMKEISRWYDVEVEYRGDLAKMRFGGTVSRFKNVSELLKTMELTGSIHFKIEGRRIIVMP